MYIVVFNVGYRDSEIMTTSNGFIEEFPDPDSAAETASEWIDGTQYRNFKIYKQETE